VTPMPAGDKREFRAWARAHHPDVGGDPAEFTAGLAQWRHQEQPPRRGCRDVTVFRSRHDWWLIARWRQRRRRRARAKRGRVISHVR
jgi:hypothetical protein